jgi:FkbM family methyltransferase
MKEFLRSFFALFGIAVLKRSTLDYLEQKAKSNAKPSSKSEKNNLIDNAFYLLKQAGFNPSHIIDVGANHGTWTREVMVYFNRANFTLIEPQAHMKESVTDLLKSDKFSFLPIGVGSTPGHFNLTIAERDDSCSFRHSPEEAARRGLKQVQVEVDTLDNIVKKSPYGIPQLIKIDAEGLDIEVLKGAQTLLGKTEVFLIEAAVVSPAFENTVQNVINIMDGYGYKLFEITDLNRPFSNKVLWLVELMFVLKGGPIDQKKWVE